MIAPLILLALVTGSPGSAPVRELKPNELRALFSPNDYPLEARLNRWEGATVVELMVNSSGEPIKCHIVKSSGHPLLDNKALGIDQSSPVSTCERRSRETCPNYLQSAANHVV